MKEQLDVYSVELVSDLVLTLLRCARVQLSAEGRVNTAASDANRF